MPVWPPARRALFGVLILLGLGACAPSTVREPFTPEMQRGGPKVEERYDTLMRLAAAARSRGDARSAIQLYQQAIQVNGDRPAAYARLGDVLSEVEAFDDAATVFEQALQRDPDDLQARRGYARVLLALKRPDAAIGQFEIAVAMAPGDRQAMNGLGVAYDLAGQHAAAQAVYRRGLEAEPRSLSLRNNLGLSLALAGDFEAAISLLRTVAYEPGAKSRNRQNLALAYGLAGNLEMAERISRIDLDEEDVANNLAYFAALAAVQDERLRSAALGVKTREEAAAADLDAGRRLAAIVLDGGGLELGLASSGRWFVDLGDYSGAAQSVQAWRDLQTRHAELLQGLNRFAGGTTGPQPLLVGPLATARQAQDLCTDLDERGIRTCRPMPL